MQNQNFKAHQYSFYFLVILEHYNLSLQMYWSKNSLWITECTKKPLKSSAILLQPQQFCIEKLYQKLVGTQIFPKILIFIVIT